MITLASSSFLSCSLSWVFVSWSWVFGIFLGLLDSLWDLNLVHFASIRVWVPSGRAIDVKFRIFFMLLKFLISLNHGLFSDIFEFLKCLLRRIYWKCFGAWNLMPKAWLRDILVCDTNLILWDVFNASSWINMVDKNA